jgi:NTP pyrophosphatase (non-canonical NTP hydrolase)
MTEEQKAICHKIADHYGEEHQMLKAVEEMAELTQAIVKYLDDPVEWDALCNELADVNIMIEQLNWLVSRWVAPLGYEGLTDVGHRINLKLNRQLERMERESNA